LLVPTSVFTREIDPSTVVTVVERVNDAKTGTPAMRASLLSPRRIRMVARVPRWLSRVVPVIAILIATVLTGAGLLMIWEAPINEPESTILPSNSLR
jgi:hypothetical protein